MERKGKTKTKAKEQEPNFFAAIKLLEEEKGIPQDYMKEKLRFAFIAALKKMPGYENLSSEDEENILVDFNEKAGSFSVFARKFVVSDEEAVNSPMYLTVDEARKYDADADIGSCVDILIDAKDFGRIAAQSGKQVIIQSIREAERGIIYEEFTSKEHEILTGIVSRIEPGTGAVSIKISSNSEYTEAMLPATERIKGEVLTEGNHIKVYIVEVKKSSRGPQVVISRTHPGLVKRLFELEVPEILDGTVKICSLAREAGSRTKMAVYSDDPDVDPIGACVGPKGGRVASIVDELGGEKIDIIKYSPDPEQYIASSLSPAEVVSVEILEEGKSCRVVVPDSQLSLAIGKEGQNARLAAKLTGYKIDIKPASAV